MPPGLHGELARAAERDGTSLNGYIITRLAESVGTSALEGAEETSPSRERDRSVLTWLLIANVVAVSFAGLAAVVILLVAVL